MTRLSYRRQRFPPMFASFELRIPGTDAEFARRPMAFDEIVVRLAGKRIPLACRRSRGRRPPHVGPSTARSALRLTQKLLTKQGIAPKLLVTEKLRSYGSAFRQ